MVVPGLHVEPEEPGRDGVLQVGDLHSVAVRVSTEQLNKKKQQLREAQERMKSLHDDLQQKKQKKAELEN